MERKAPPVIDLLQGKTAPPFLALYFEFYHLKQLYRQGWLQRGVPPEQCESVAEHILGVALLALLITERFFPDLDAVKVLRMALVHDFGEAYTGDLTPADGVPVEEKHRLEQAAVEEMFGRLPDGERYILLWLEYAAASTPEARLVKELDRLEMALQASVYEHLGYSPMQDFYDSAARMLESPTLQQMLQDILQARPGQT